MVHKSFFLFILLLGLFCCSKPKEEKTTLKDEELVNLMLDLHLAEVVLPTLTPIEQDSFKNVYWRKLSSHYNMTEEQIRHEVQLLESDTEKMKKIVALVKTKADSLK